MAAELVNLYSLIVLIAIVLSWVPSLRETRFGHLIDTVTEPVFERIRRVVPPLGGFDWAPMVLLLALQLLRRLVS